MLDPYERSAEFLDLLIAGTWQSLGPALGEVLQQVRAGSGPVADVGAGTGRGVRAICAALPGDDPVLAVEPSSVMRAVLLARVHEAPELRERVTVLAQDAAHASLPDGLRAIVAVNVLGHLPPDERRFLWESASRRLAPGGALIVSVTPPFVPERIPRTRMATATVGALHYEGWATAEPSGADEITWRMDYRVLRDGLPLSEVAVDYRWWVASEGQLAEEAAEAGLVMRAAGKPDLGLQLLTRQGE
ncbi:class I SAM-dependent methyltransferase [Streptomyces sp. NPDC050704]|uniref:class I SAM-dependent methyltransferase n=1 Tax=Streptomyces sp. NPDC050704 TaxID=3157219 RepID=UPI0034388172